MSVAQRALLSFVRGYRLLLSPWLGNSCRFEPTCSVYALQAIEEHGATVGAYLTASRLLRCQPFCRGGHDPVPSRPPVPFRTLMPGVGNGRAITPTNSEPRP
jgi:putative membrane protein insertion efficiency factor